MYFGIYGKRVIEKLMPRGKRPILIRILPPSDKEEGIPPSKLEHIDKYVDVLELYFNEIIDEEHQSKEEFVYFSKDMAMQLNDFILRNDFDEIAIHCSVGIQRSPSVGLCVAKILDNPKLEAQIKNFGRFDILEQVVSTFDSIPYQKKPFHGDIIFRNLDIYQPYVFQSGGRDITVYRPNLKAENLKYSKREEKEHER